MGGFCGRYVSPEDLKSKQIDKQLQESQKQDRDAIKMLLLGAGECGKTTLLRQIRIVHDESFGVDERASKKWEIIDNVMRTISDLYEGGVSLHLLFDKEAEEAYALVKSAITRKELRISLAMKAALTDLWDNRTIQRVFTRRHEVQIADNIAYFMSHIERISEANYSPSNEDFLHLRTRTTGISETRITVKDGLRSTPFIFYDVGGQRSERRKWTNAFDQVNAIIFLSAISEFDQVLSEDKTMNRLMESMEVFKSVVSNPFFASATLILFLNKIDLFKEKIKKKSINILFKEYGGPMEYFYMLRHIKGEFLRIAKVHRVFDDDFDGGDAFEAADDRRRVYVHETCAIDANQVGIIVQSVLNELMRKSLQQAGIVV